MFCVVLLHLLIDLLVNKVLNNKSLGLSQQQSKNYKGFSSIYNDIRPGKAAKPNTVQLEPENIWHIYSMKRH